MSMTLLGERLELRSEIEVDATAQDVWVTLTELSRYEEWNPFLADVRGNLAEGARVKVTVCLPEGPEIRIRRRVLRLKPAEELRWVGNIGCSWLLRTEQRFGLIEPAPRRCRLAVVETFTGLWVQRSGPRLLQIARGQALMNQALKRRVESA